MHDTIASLLACMPQPQHTNDDACIAVHQPTVPKHGAQNAPRDHRSTCPDPKLSGMMLDMAMLMLCCLVARKMPSLLPSLSVCSTPAVLFQTLARYYDMCCQMGATCSKGHPSVHGPAIQLVAWLFSGLRLSEVPPGIVQRLLQLRVTCCCPGTIVVPESRQLAGRQPLQTSRSMPEPLHGDGPYGGLTLTFTGLTRCAAFYKMTNIPEALNA
jgi:hypothetical protein